MARQFGSGSAFKASLEAHLRKRAEQTAMPLGTLQLKFVIERLLARLFRTANPPWLLKGGFAMDLRFRPKARTTKDIDLSVALTAHEEESNAESLVTLREKLQEASDVDLGDYLTYRIGEARRELTNAPRGGVGGRFVHGFVLGNWIRWRRPELAGPHSDGDSPEPVLPNWQRPNEQLRAGSPIKGLS